LSVLQYTHWRPQCVCVCVCVDFGVQNLTSNVHLYGVQDFDL